MNPVIDLTKEYGIVLEGGGARGAYQIGVWKALQEAGVKIKGIAGTSVGALNGALMCMGDLKNAEDVWNTITYSRVMKVDDNVMESLFSGEIGFRKALSEAAGVLTEGGVDITPLKELIAGHVDGSAIQASPIDLYVQTFSVNEMKEIDVDMKHVEEELIPDFLLASAYLFPIFKNEKLHGKTYIDGGAINNVPLDSLIRRGYQDIITIRIFGPGREKRVKIPEETNIISIEPRVKLGNIIEFTSRKSQRNIKIGYYDGLRAIYGLKGTIYYIEENEEECYYLNQLITIDPQVSEYLMEVYRQNSDKELTIRNLTEAILPAMAMELRLQKTWTYRELYLAMLEATAKMCRVPKYKVYTVPELQEAVHHKLYRLHDQDIPAFMQIISKYILI